MSACGRRRGMYTTMAAFEAAIADLGRVVAPLLPDPSPRGQLFQVAKQIHEELVRLTGFVKAHSAKDMILSARTVTTAVNGFVASAQTVSDAVPQRTERENLMSHALQVKHFGVQMKMLLAVRAAGSAADASSTSAEDAQLKTCVQGIVDEVKFILALPIFRPPPPPSSAASATEANEEEADPFAGGVQWQASDAFAGKR